MYEVDYHFATIYWSTSSDGEILVTARFHEQPAENSTGNPILDIDGEQVLLKPEQVSWVDIELFAKINPEHDDIIEKGTVDIDVGMPNPVNVKIKDFIPQAPKLGFKVSIMGAKGRADWEIKYTQPTGTKPERLEVVWDEGLNIEESNTKVTISGEEVGNERVDVDAGARVFRFDLEGIKAKSEVVIKSSLALSPDEMTRLWKLPENEADDKSVVKYSATATAYGSDDTVFPGISPKKDTTSTQSWDEKVLGRKGKVKRLLDMTLKTGNSK